MKGPVRRLSATLAVVAGVVATALAASATAATTYPTASFTPNCTDYGSYGGDVITMQPTQIDGQPGVGYGVLTGNTFGVVNYNTPSTAIQGQYIYYWLQVYTPTRGWTTSNPKRVLDSYATSLSIGGAQEWDSQLAGWLHPTQWDFSPSSDVNNGQIYQDLEVPPDDVGLHAPQGAGSYYATLYVYWAPPFSVSPSPKDPTIPSGGIGTHTSTVLVTCR